MRITCRAKPSQETWNRTLDKEGAVRVAESALQEGVVFLTAEQYGNVVWLPVSFPITDGGLEEDACILTRLVSELASVHYPVACAVPKTDLVRCGAALDLRADLEHPPSSYQFSNDSRKMLASSAGPACLGAMLNCRCCLSAPSTRPPMSFSS